MAAYQAANPNDSSVGNDAVWDDLEKLNDDVSKACCAYFVRLFPVISSLTTETLFPQIELLCDKLSVEELTSLSDILGGPDAIDENGNATTVRVEALADVKKCADETAAGAEHQSLMAIQQRNLAREAAADKAREAKLSKASNPWSKDELGALAKAVKKYPPGGSNRWDAITLFVNNLCKLNDPRTKEDCIEKYNQIAASSSAPPSSLSAGATSSTTATPAAATASAEDTDGAWSDEQDSLLQEMLRKYPADMDKNERWKAIAKGVPGRTKKECVSRFKAIREAVRQGKS